MTGLRDRLALPFGYLGVGLNVGSHTYDVTGLSLGMGGLNGTCRKASEFRCVGVAVRWYSSDGLGRRWCNLFECARQISGKGALVAFRILGLR